MDQIPLAALVAARLAAAAECTNYAVAAADHSPGIAYVTGPGMDQATAILVADPCLLLTRCYAGNEMALVVTAWHPTTHPAVAPTTRPVPPVPECPTTRDLWGDVVLAGVYTGPDRRTRQRTARDHWFTWAVRGIPINWTTEATPPALTPADRAENMRLLRGY